MVITLRVMVYCNWQVESGGGGGGGGGSLAWCLELALHPCSLDCYYLYSQIFLQWKYINENM